MVTSNLSMKAAAVRSRIQRLPHIVEGIPEYRAKRLAKKTIQVFHDGIKRNRFALEPLKEATVSAKEAAGYDKPGTPLYALGDRGTDTYANMLEVVKLEARRWVVQPREGYHEKRLKDGSIVHSNLTLKKLYEVHEFGASIDNGKTIIVIPPRPALHIAYRRVLKITGKADPAVAVRTAIARFVKIGNADMLYKFREEVDENVD